MNLLLRVKLKKETPTAAIPKNCARFRSAEVLTLARASVAKKRKQILRVRVDPETNGLVILWGGKGQEEEASYRLDLLRANLKISLS